jgi:tetrahydromethanopterin S-methyltransferase subunit F
MRSIGARLRGRVGGVQVRSDLALAIGLVLAVVMVVVVLVAVIVAGTRLLT